MRTGQFAFDEGVASITAFYAENFRERGAGLLALPPLKSGEGLLLPGCGSVHTWGMKYALDLVYISRRMRILKLVTDLPPRRFSACWRAVSTLELPSGTVARLELVRGMKVHWTEKDISA